MVTR
jgi:hypothetical protein